MKIMDHYSRVSPRGITWRQSKCIHRTKKKGLFTCIYFDLASSIRRSLRREIREKEEKTMLQYDLYYCLS
jgi:hypothetical protein